jgi:outer membrane protein assembly factor BamB
VLGSHVFVHSDAGFLFKLRLADGGEVWRARVETEPVQRIPPGEPGSRYDHFASSACVANGKVYVGSAEAQLHALDEESGERLWSFHTEDVIGSTPVVSDGAVFFGSFDGKVYAVEANRGGLLWAFDTGAAVVSSPALTGGHVLIGSRSYDLFALDQRSGVPAWTFYCWFSWIESSVALRDGVAYVGSSDAQALFALEGAIGRPLWRFDTGGSAWAQPAVSEDAVFIGSVGVADYIVNHQASFFAVDGSSGSGRWSFPLERPERATLWGFASSPAWHGDRVFVGGLNGRVYAFPAQKSE